MGTEAPRRRRGDTSGAGQRQAPRRRRRPERTGPGGLGQAVHQLQGTGQPSELREGAQAVVVAQVGDARPHLRGARRRHGGEGIVEGPRVQKIVARRARTDGAVNSSPATVASSRAERRPCRRPNASAAKELWVTRRWRWEPHATKSARHRQPPPPPSPPHRPPPPRHRGRWQSPSAPTWTAESPPTSP